MKITTPVILMIFCLTAISVVPPLWAAEKQSAEDLAKKIQNPVADLISVPFQNDFNFSAGPDDELLYVLNIQPVIPFHLSKKWNLITRRILPIISQSGFAPGQDRVNGIGDIQFTAFLSPPKAEGLIWGVGPIVQLPTNSNDRLVSDRWGLGPSVVVLRLVKASPWVYGALVNNVWSINGSSSDPSYNKFLLQPFLNYNSPGGFYLSSAPILTANWKADSDDR